MPDALYLLAIVATATFAVTGVLAAGRAHIDIFGVTVVGFVTAVGGGTLRDVILDAPVFWVEDATYVVVAVLAAVSTFLLGNMIQKRFQVLLYLDALGVALFASLAVIKTLSLGLNPALAAVMGVMTGIGGGVIRDLLTGRPTLVMSRDLYATPILLGVGVQLAIISLGWLGMAEATLVGGVVVFLGRAAAIHFHLQMPDVLVYNPKG